MEGKKEYKDMIDKLEKASFPMGVTNGLYINALAIVIECIKWDGDPIPILNHGYVHEKATRINNILEDYPLEG